MKKFALLLCRTKSEQDMPKKGLFAARITDLKEFFRSLRKEKFFNGALKTVQVDKELELSLITLPYTLAELRKIRSRRRIRQINEFLYTARREQDFAYCIVPECIAEIHSFENCICSPFTGEYLYRCLLGNILEDIFTKRGINIWDLDIVLAQGERRESLYTVIELLSPIVRFLTVVSDEQDQIEEEAGETFLDSGLSVIITSDWKSAFKNADVIINLKQEQEIASNIKTKKGSVFINISGLKASAIHCESALIQGLHVGIPRSLYDQLDSNVWNFLEPCELAEAIITIGLGLEEQVMHKEFPQFELMKKASKEFKKGGYRLTGFAGRHNTLYASDIAVREV